MPCVVYPYLSHGFVYLGSLAHPHCLLVPYSGETGMSGRNLTKTSFFQESRLWTFERSREWCCEWPRVKMLPSYICHPPRVTASQRCLSLSHPVLCTCRPLFYCNIHAPPPAPLQGPRPVAFGSHIRRPRCLPHRPRRCGTGGRPRSRVSRDAVRGCSKACR